MSDDLQRSIGQLEGKLDTLITDQREFTKEVRQDIKGINDKLHSQNVKVAVTSAGAGGIVGFITSWAKIHLGSS